MLNPYIAVLILVRYRVFGFEAGGRRQRAGGRCQMYLMSPRNAIYNLKLSSKLDVAELITTLKLIESVNISVSTQKNQ